MVRLLGISALLRIRRWRSQDVQHPLAQLRAAVVCNALLLAGAHLWAPMVTRGLCRKNERPAAELANQKWGWIATTPGSWAELEVDTTTAVQVGF